jgi:hypothetical protein
MESLLLCESIRVATELDLEIARARKRDICTHIVRGWETRLVLWPESAPHSMGKLDRFLNAQKRHSNPIMMLASKARVQTHALCYNMHGVLLKEMPIHFNKLLTMAEHCSKHMRFLHKSRQHASICAAHMQKEPFEQNWEHTVE